jgi:hypothetical protein
VGLGPGASSARTLCGISPGELVGALGVPTCLNQQRSLVNKALLKPRDGYTLFNPTVVYIERSFSLNFLLVQHDLGVPFPAVKKRARR